MELRDHPTGTRLERAADRIVGLFSPERMYIRQHFRRMDRDDDYRDCIFALLRMQGYRAAKDAKGSTGWFGGGGSADVELLGDLPKLRNRSREINRDDPIGTGLTGTFVKNVIGTGMRAQARCKDTRKNEGMESVWRERKDELQPADRINHGVQQRMGFAKVLEDGEVLVKETKRSASDAVFFEMIEGDRLGDPSGYKPPSNHYLRDGIEKERGTDIPMFYHIRKSACEDLSGPYQSPSQMKFEKVAAAQIRHLKLVRRPGQSRGEPLFHAILQDLRDLDLLLLASLKRTQIAACLALFIKSEAKSTNILPLTAQRYGFKLDQTIEPGMIFKLYPGEEIQTLLPNFPVPELEPFIIMIARRIGAALGVSWQIVLKDFSNANYSSARTDLLEARQSYGLFQDWFRDELLNWQWFIVMQDAALRDDPRMAGITPDEMRQVYWIPNGWRWVDPLKEAQATEIRMKLGIDTMRDVCAGEGRDWEEQMVQKALEETRRKELGQPSIHDLPAAPIPADSEADIRPFKKGRAAA